MQDEELAKAMEEAGITRRILANHMGWSYAKVNNAMNHPISQERRQQILTGIRELAGKRAKGSPPIDMRTMLSDGSIAAMTNEELAKELVRVREARKLTREELAEELGMTPASLRKAEMGEGTMCYDRVSLYHVYCGLAEDLKLKGDEERDLLRCEITWQARLRKARLKRHMSMNKAAEFVGVGHSTFAGWETGRYIPNNFWPEQIVDYLAAKRDTRPERMDQKETYYSTKEKCWVRLERKGGHVTIYHEGDKEPPRGQTEYERRKEDKDRKEQELQAIYAQAKTPWWREGLSELEWKWKRERLAEEAKQKRRMERAAARKEPLKRTAPAGIGQTCVICGKPLPEKEKSAVRCDDCRSLLGQKPKGFRANEERLYNEEELLRIAATMRNNGDLYQWRCIGCAHAETMGNGVGVCCMYLGDSMLYGLPKRPRPSGEPSACLYKSIHEDCCTDIPPERAGEIVKAGPFAMLDKETARVYINEEELEAAGLTEADKSRLRRLKPEERRMLREQFKRGGRFH